MASGWNKMLDDWTPGKPVSAAKLNEMTRQLNALTAGRPNAGGAACVGGMVLTRSGPRRKTAFHVVRIKSPNPFSRFQNTTAIVQEFDESEPDDWVNTDTEVTLYGGFFAGMAFPDDLVKAEVRDGRYYGIGCGRVFVRGVLESDLAPNGSATLRLIEEPASGIGYNSQDHTINVRERLGDGGTVVSGSRVYANWDEYDQIWIATGAACS